MSRAEAELETSAMQAQPADLAAADAARSIEPEDEPLINRISRRSPPISRKRDRRSMH